MKNPQTHRIIYYKIIISQFHIETLAFKAWPGGVLEGRAAFATMSALPSHIFKLSIVDGT